MFSVAQIRALQSGLSAVLSVRPGAPSPAYQSLQTALTAAGGSIASSRILSVSYPDAPKLRGLLFRYETDAASAARLILPGNREAPASLHLDLPKSENRPTLLELSYIHMTRRKAAAAHYLLAGGLDAFPDSDFEYSRQARRTESLALFSELLYRLNTPVADLPYPKGRKVAIVDALKKLGVTYVGELVRKDESALRGALGEMGWITIRSIIQNWKLAFGIPIPQWRAPRR